MLADIDHTAPVVASLAVAIVDDDSGFLRCLTNRLDTMGWTHQVLPEPPSTDAIIAMRIGALVLDPSVLGGQPWGYVERLCGALPGLAVVLCTRDSTLADRVRGLRLGADDWVTKPCHPEELIARVEVAVRRRRHAEFAEPRQDVLVGELELRPEPYDAFVAGTPVGLSRREFEILHLLALADGRILSREDVYVRVWGYAMAHGDRSIDVVVHKLRGKLRRASPGWRYIRTIFGVGYGLEPQQL